MARAICTMCMDEESTVQNVRDDFIHGLFDVPTENKNVGQR